MEDGKQFLQSSYKTFVDKMNKPSLKQLLDYLYQEDILTEAEMDEIKAGEKPLDRNRNAFAIIIKKGIKVHETVIQYLKDNHKHEYEAMAEAAEKKKMRFGQTQASTGSQSDIEKYTDEHLEEIIKNLTEEVGVEEVKRIENEVKDKVLKKKWAFPPSTVHAIYKDKTIHTFLTKEASECSGKAFPLKKVIGCLFIRRAKAKTNPQVDTSNNSSNESESMEDSIEESLTENSPTGGKSMGTHSQSDMRSTLRDNNPINNDSKDNCLNPPESIDSDASNTGQRGSLDSGVSSLSQNNTSKEDICDIETQQSSVTVDDSRLAFTEDVPISETFGNGLPAIKTILQRSEKMQNKSVNKNDGTSLRKSQFSGTANPIPTENASPKTSREVRTMVKSDPRDDEHSDNRVNQAFNRLTESRQENSPTGSKFMGFKQSDISLKDNSTMCSTLRDNNPINYDSKDNCLNPPESIDLEASNNLLTFTGQRGSLDSGVSSLSQNNTSKEDICDIETQQSSVTVDDSRPAFTEDVPISETFGKGLPAIKTIPQRSEKMQNKSVNKNDGTSQRKSQFSGTANPIPTENASPETSREVRTMVKSDPRDDEHSDNRVNQAFNRLTESRQENSPTGSKFMGFKQSDISLKDNSTMCSTLRDNNPINYDSKDNCLNPPESIDLEASNNLLTFTGQRGSLDSGVSSLSQNNTSKEDICDIETQQSSVTVDDSRPAFTEDVPISETFGKGLPAIKTIPQRSEKMQNKSVNKNDGTSQRKSQFSGTANPIPTENASPETSREVRTMVKSDPRDDEHSDNRVNQAFNRLTESRQENSPTGSKFMGFKQSDISLKDNSTMCSTLRDNNPINNDSKDNCLNPPESIDLEASNNLLTFTGQRGSLDSGVSSLSQNDTSKEDICDIETQQSSVTVDDSRPAFGKGLPAIKTIPQRSEKMQNKSVNKNDGTSLRKSQFSGTANPIPTENASPETSREVRTMVKSDPRDDEHSDNRVNQASADADVDPSACKESSPKKRKSKTQHLEEQKSGNRNKKGRSEKIDILKKYFKEKKIAVRSTLKCINYREHNECRLFNVHDSMVYYDVNSKQDVLLITETPKEKSDTSKDNPFPQILNRDGLVEPYESKLQLRMGILGNIIRAHVLFSGNKKPPYKLSYKKTYFLDVLDKFKSFVVEILIPVLAVYKQSQKETILKDYE